jgi:UDP:flavonoid glycosyltransferase YjiC (YdhE family)
MPLYLVPSSPELDYGRDDLYSSLHYVGPYVRHSQSAENSHRGEEETGRRRVLVMEGTNHGSDPWLLRAGWSALGKEPFSVIPVAGLDRKAAESHIRTIVPEVRLLGLGECEDLIASADVVVTGGSSEIVLPALSHGVPLVLAPSILEESAMSRRVADCGAGVLIPAKRCTAPRLRAAVTRVLEDPSFRRQAKRMAETFQRCGGPDGAAALLESMAISYRPVTPNI